MYIHNIGSVLSGGGAKIGSDFSLIFMATGA